MAAGDTISGQLRVNRVSESEGTVRILGPISHSQADRKANPEKALFVNKMNPKVLGHIQPHLDSPGVSAPKGIFRPGETIQIQHKSASLEEAADYDADEFFVTVLDIDQNTGIVTPLELTVAQTELSANPTTSTSSWVTIYEETVPDRHVYVMAGPFMVAAVEAA